MTRISPALAATTAVTALIAGVSPWGGPAQAASPAPECRNGDLHATYRGGDHALSHTLGRIVLSNVSGHACTVRGFGGLSYVGHGDGTQVGAAATRDPGTAVRTIRLAPGERARSEVSETSTGPYAAARCHAVAVDGFRVYVPGARVSQFVAHPTTTCADTDLRLLGHQAFRRS